MNQSEEAAMFAEMIPKLRDSIRVWAKTGVVHSVKLKNADLPDVCLACKNFNAKIFPLKTEHDIKLIVDNIPIKDCANPRCRCSWSPEEGLC